MSSGLKVAVPIAVGESNLVSSIPWLGFSGAWDSVTNFGGTRAVVSHAGSFWQDISTGSNVNHTPGSSPTYWQAITLPLWAPGTTYAAGTRVLHLVAGGGAISGIHWFESLQSGNLAHDPPNTGLDDAWWQYLGPNYGWWFPANWPVDTVLRYGDHVYRALAVSSGGTPVAEVWADLGVINHLKMFDERLATQTSFVQDIVSEIAVTGRVDTVALLGVDATEINIRMLDGASEVYNRTFSMVSTAGISSWHAYFYAPIRMKRAMATFDLPLVLDPTVIITVSNPAGTAAVGKCVLGRSETLGEPEIGARTPLNSLSRIERDELGERSIVRRGFVKNGSYRIMVRRDDEPWVLELLSGLLDTPALFVGDEEREITIHFGIAVDVEPLIDLTTHSYISLTIDEY